MGTAVGSGVVAGLQGRTGVHVACLLMSTIGAPRLISTVLLTKYLQEWRVTTQTVMKTAGGGFAVAMLTGSIQRAAT